MARPIQIKIKFHINFAPELRKPNDICQSLVRTLKRCAHLNTCRIDSKTNYLARGHRNCISGNAGMREHLSLLSRRFWSKFKAMEERAGPFSPLKSRSESSTTQGGTINWCTMLRHPTASREGGSVSRPCSQPRSDPFEAASINSDEVWTSQNRAQRCKFLGESMPGDKRHTLCFARQGTSVPRSSWKRPWGWTYRRVQSLEGGI